MKIIAIIRGDKLHIEENYWDKISIKGDLDKVYFVNEGLNRRIRPIEHEGIIEFYGDKLELVINTNEFIMISGDVKKYYIYNKEGKLGVIHNLTPRDFI